MRKIKLRTEVDVGAPWKTWWSKLTGSHALFTSTQARVRACNNLCSLHAANITCGSRASGPALTRLWIRRNRATTRNVLVVNILSGHWLYFKPHRCIWLYKLVTNFPGEQIFFPSLGVKGLSTWNRNVTAGMFMVWIAIGGQHEDRVVRKLMAEQRVFAAVS